MKAKIKQLLFEAYRRSDMADSLEKSKPISQRWLGLGTYTTYSPAIKEGFMRFHHIPPKRCMGWLVLTEKGITALIDLIPEFHEKLEKLKKNPDYKDSKVAYYSLIPSDIKSL